MYLAKLTDGQAVVVAIEPGTQSFSVIAGADATATVSRVDSLDASEHTTGTENSYTVAESTIETIIPDWPFYRVSVAGGDARVGSV